MSESVEQGANGQFSGDSGGQAQVTAGTLLRQARESAGLHIAVLAVSLKVPVKKLEALETDQIDLLPDAVFARALAASVCRTLKIDPTPVLDKLPQNPAPRLAQDEGGINTPFRAPGGSYRPSFWNQLSRPVILAVLALLLGALVLIFLPTVNRDASVTIASPSATVSAVVAPAALPIDKVTEGRTDLQQAATATPAPAATVAVAPDAGAIVVFNARAESWVQVTDAKGTVALRKILAPAEVSEASGVLPLSVVVGRADAIQVQVRGKPFDLAPSTKNNIARFEVK